MHNNPIRRCMFIGIERLTCLPTLRHFIASKDLNCLAGNLKGKLDGLSDIENMEEVKNAS